MSEEILDDFELERTRDYRNVSRILIDGREIVFLTFIGNINLGNEVLIEGKLAKDGLYRIQNDNIRYEVKSGKLIHEYYIEKYKQKNGGIIEIDGSRIFGITKGSRVWINDEKIKDGVYKMGWIYKIKVIDGLIDRVFVFS